MGNDVGQHWIMGCDVGRENRRRVYLRCLLSRRTETGGRAASLWSASVGVDLKALRMHLSALFCCNCSSRSRFRCLFHQMGSWQIRRDMDHKSRRLKGIQT
jgi:hypothetical protein